MTSSPLAVPVRTNNRPIAPPAPVVTPAATEVVNTSFQELGLTAALVNAVREEGYTQPTPIQVRAIPHVLEGKDLLGCAQTGTGKTAAFALPILQRLGSRPVSQGRAMPRALILSPTRELASQIAASFAAYGKHTGLKCAVIFGGVSQHSQEKALRMGADIIVATPGRLLDLMQQRIVAFTQLEVFVLDEADRMLDMGFLPDVKRIMAAIPRKRQTLLFSATMPPAIEGLANTMLTSPVRVEVTPVASTAEKISQSIYFVDRARKAALLEHLLRDSNISRALVFTRTKRGANQVALRLSQASIRAEAIHGNKSQGARERALSNFKDGQIRVLVATDIAARGIDVDSVSHVVNYELPEIAETYVHRIGRTARAGANGIALSFCDASERPLLRSIERLIRMPVVVAEHPFAGGAAASGEGAPESSPRAHVPSGTVRGQAARFRPRRRSY
jgi:ATP-dependent RNA helicase RhlE